MKRRDFLHPRQLAETAGQILGACNLPEPSAPAPDYTLLRVSRRAMATQFEIALPFDTPNALAAAEDALDTIDRLEAQLTVYRPSSEVSRLNRLAASVPVPVAPELFHLLTTAAQLTLDTEGAFDVAVGALIKAWGFFRRQGRIPSPEEREEALRRVGMHHVVFDRAKCSVRYLVPGVAMNLGSIGKGYALDKTAELLRRDWKISAGLLHGGHSSVYAIGSQPGAQRGWSVGIRHPWQLDRRLACVQLKDRALGTSAATFQHLEHEGRKLGHLLDPRSGWPAEGIASATALAPTAAEADALATAFFILGVDKTAAYCRSHPGIGAVLLPENADLPQIFGVAPDDFELISPLHRNPENCAT